MFAIQTTNIYQDLLVDFTNTYEDTLKNRDCLNDFQEEVTRVVLESQIESEKELVEFLTNRVFNGYLAIHPVANNRSHGDYHEPFYAFLEYESDNEDEKYLAYHAFVNDSINVNFKSLEDKSITPPPYYKITQPTEDEDLNLRFGKVCYNVVRTHISNNSMFIRLSAEDTVRNKTYELLITESTNSFGF